MKTNAGLMSYLQNLPKDKVPDELSEDKFDRWLTDVLESMLSFPMVAYYVPTDEYIHFDGEGNIVDRYWANSWDDWAD